MKYYHVTKKWDGGDLVSLYNREGDDAYDIYAERWPEAGGLADAHINLIHLHDNIDAAYAFVRDYGGEILCIELDDDAIEECGIKIDDIEYSHPVACEKIPAEYIKKL